MCDSENPNKNNKTYIQKVIHQGVLEHRPRSSSFSGTTEYKNSDPTRSPEIFAQPEKSLVQKQLPPEWQRVPTNKKRKIREDSPPAPPPTQLGNQFSGLPLDPEDNSSLTCNRPNNPPPIILYGIEDVKELTKLIESTIPSVEFRFKIVNKNLLRLMVNTADHYKKIIDLIRQKGLIGHTFTRKETKPYRVVIKNLHHTTPHEAIVEEIEKSGNKVRGEIINARFGVEKKPLDIFFVNIEPNFNNKTVKDIKFIFHQRVKIEDPRKSRSIVQCQRCQQYGHSKNNCMRPFRCVKCGEGHSTSDCPKKDRNTPARCALCASDHPANYKGCKVYKEILSRKRNGPNRTSTSHPAGHEVAPPTKKSPATTINQTYAEITKSTRNQADPKKLSDNNNHSQHYSSSDNNHSHQTTTVEQLLLKQSEKIDLLLQQISTLLNLLTTIIPKLAK